MPSGEDSDRRPASLSTTNAERSRLEYLACAEIRPLLPEEPGELLLRAALAGHAGAQVRFASEYIPAGFDDWAEDEQEAHRLQSGWMIAEALTRCEPSAFLAIATGLNQGRLWHLPLDSVPSAVRGEPEPLVRLAYRVAFDIFLRERTVGAAEAGLLDENWETQQSHIWSHLNAQR